MFALSYMQKQFHLDINESKSTYVHCSYWEAVVKERETEETRDSALAVVLVLVFFR